jgi:MFS family permease
VTTAALPTRNLWTRDFTTYWLASAAAACADAIAFVALPFLVLDLTGDKAALATSVLLGSLPRFAAPLIGSLADRLPLRLPLTAAALLRAAAFAGLAYLAVNGQLSVAAIYAASLLNGLLMVFTYAVGSVTVPHLVAREDLARANSLFTGANMGLPLAGYGIGGALVTAAGPAVTVGVAATGALALALAAQVVQFPRPAVGQRESLLAEFLEAASFLSRGGQLGLLLAMSFTLNASLSVLNVLVPARMLEIGRGAPGYGLFESLVSAGALCGIVLVGLVARRVRPTAQVTAGNSGIIAALPLLAVGSFPTLLAGGVVGGIGLGFLEVSAVTMLQLMTPDGMRGKLMGLVVGVNAFGLAVGAWAAGQVAVPLLLALLLVTMVGTTAAWAAGNRRLRERN